MDQFEKAMKEIEFNQAKKDILDEFDITIQTFKMISKMEYEYFKALLEEGFTEQQALYIVAKQGINIGGKPGQE